MELFQSAGGQTSYCHSFEEFKIIDRLLLQMKDKGTVFKESLFIMIMRHYGRAGLPGQATRILLDMWNTFSCESTFKSSNQVLDILLAGNCPKVAPNVFYEMLGKGISSSVFSFSRVIQALCTVNEVDSACSLLRDMTKHGCVPNSVIYQILIRALPKSNRIFLMGCIPDINTSNEIIHGLCRANRIHEAAKLIDRMLLRGFTPDTITYGFSMHAFCQTGRVDEARVLLNKASEQNNVLFNTLMNGYNMLIKGYQPDVYTYNILIRGLCKRESCLQLMKFLIDGFSKVGRLQEAYDLVTEMSAESLSLNIVGYNSLISSLSKQGMVQQTLDIFGDMSSNGCKPDTFMFNALILGFCKIDKMDEALGMYRDMFLEGVIANTVTYNTLIHAFLRKGKTQEALKLVNDMLFRGCPVDDITYNGLIKALCNDGAIEPLGLFEEMMRKETKPNHVTCNILMNNFFRITSLISGLFTYNGLITSLCNNGRIREARNLFEKLELEGICPDTIAYNTLISCYCKLHMLDDAYTTVY
ncbi:unnamed protein product [Withania somnifera]